MGKKYNKWQLQDLISEAKVAIVNAREIHSQADLFRFSVGNIGATAHSIAGVLLDTIAISRWCEVLIATEEDPQKAWRLSHLLWQYHAFSWCAYLESAERLAEDYPDKARSGRFPIGQIDERSFADICMTLAWSMSIGEDAAARWFGDRCLSLAGNPKPYCSSVPGKGPIGNFILSIYCRWSGVGHEQFDQFLADEYLTTLNTTPGTEEFTSALSKISNVHESMVLKRSRPIRNGIYGLNTGPYTAIPVEILALALVKRIPSCDLARYSECPILSNVLAQFPRPCPKHEKDEYLLEAIRLIQEKFPRFNIPWE